MSWGDSLVSVNTEMEGTLGDGFGVMASTDHSRDGAAVRGGDGNI